MSAGLMCAQLLRKMPPIYAFQIAFHHHLHRIFHLTAADVHWLSLGARIYIAAENVFRNWDTKDLLMTAARLAGRPGTVML